MPTFRIEQMNGHSVRHPINGVKYVIHWVVQVFNYSANAWIHLKSFYSKRRAENYVRQLEKEIAGGDYSCLTLRS